MYQQKLLFWCSFFYYLVNIYSIQIVVLLYLQGGGLNIAYFITFFCVFGIDKLIIILIMVYGDRDGGILFSICDMFQIGFIYIFFDDQFQSYELSISLKTKVYSRIVPQIIMEFIFFFCLKGISNDDNSQTVKIVTLFNFVLFLVLFSCLMHFAKVYDDYKYSDQRIYNFKEKAFIFCKFFLTQLPYYLSICAFIFCEDKLGINLSYYNIVLALLTIIGYYIYKRPSLEDFSQFIFNYICFNGFRINHFDFDRLTSSTYMYLSISTYINQMIRVILLFVFSQDDILKYSDDNNTVLQILIQMTLALSFLQFIFLFKENYYILFKTLKITICSYLVIDEINEELRNNKFQNIQIIIYDNSNNNNSQELIFEDRNNQNLIQNLIMSSFEQQILHFVELITKCEKSKNYFHIYFLGLPHYFSEFKFQILTKLENVFDRLFSSLTESLQENQCLQILKARTKNGFLLSEINRYLIQKIFNQEFQLNNYRCIYLQITLFDKLISPNMQFQPSQILYDLYKEY